MRGPRPELVELWERIAELRAEREFARGEDFTSDDPVAGSSASARLSLDALRHSEFLRTRRLYPAFGPKHARPKGLM